MTEGASEVARQDSLDCAVHLHSPPEAKIRLFRSLFRGREDVYPRRFESRKTGRAGYQPACGNEWVRGLCEKPKIKCSDCPHQRFLPVTDDVIRCHLSGKDPTGQAFVAGVYRRDREKDALLQEHGYRVLRFLAEDVGQQLDRVLDAVIRALARIPVGTTP